MIYDCFTFYNELDLLEIRLNVLKGVVDKFVLIENTVTYTNQKKPLFYQNNKHRYKDFQNKIIHIVVKDSPNVSHPWIIEHYLMAASKRGLTNANKEDLILISNLDEIPDPQKIIFWKNKRGKLKVFEQKFFYYYLNLVATNRTWLGTKMLTYKDFLTYQDAYVVRHSPNSIIIPGGGWHFSYMGGIKKIQEKMATGSHQEFNNSAYNTKEKILRAIREKRDVFGHGDTFDFIPFEELPEYLQQNKKRYEKLFIQPGKITALHPHEKFLLSIMHQLRVRYREVRKNKTANSYKA